MELIYILLLVAGLVQIGVYFYGKNSKNVKNKKSKEKETTILEKYNIKSRGDLFKLINSHHLPENDREQLEKYYQKNS